MNATVSIELSAAASIPNVNPLPSKPAFNAEFIERRMAEHRAWQEQAEIELATEIVREIEGAIILRAAARLAESPKPCRTVGLA